jgi:hypothetical protein
MLTAMLAVRNLFGESHDLWAVNADDEYHEEQGTARTKEHSGITRRSTQPAVPRLL